MDATPVLIGDVRGRLNLTNADRLTQVASAGTISEAAIADGVSGDVLTISATLTAPRALTLPDQAVTITAAGAALIDDADASAQRSTLGLVIGTNVQAYDPGLASIAGLTTAADRMIYTTASDTYAVATITAAGAALIDDADASAQRTTLGLGSIATQAATNVAITGGSISGLTALSVGADGIDVNPGSDIDADLLTVGVTGAPRLWWDESEDAFTFTHGILGTTLVASASITYDGFTLSKSTVFSDHSWFNGTTFARTVDDSFFRFAGGSAFNTGAIVDMFGNSHATKPGSIDISPGGSGTVNVNSANGIDVNPGSDIDADLLTVGVTGAPRLWWDESEDAFASTHKIICAGDIATAKFLCMTRGSNLTIASGAVTVTASQHRVDTESGAASDDLDTITGGTEGALLVLWAANDARTVVLKDGTGNLDLAGDFSLTHTRDRITLFYDGTNWVEISRSDNAA